MAAHSTRKFTLLGWPVLQPFRISLADQAYEILCREIHGQRWTLGEVFPSIAALAEQSGMGRGPIQQAFGRLREEGYVAQDGRRGTSLLSLAPSGATSPTVIGVAILILHGQGPTEIQSVDSLRIHFIREAAAVRNCVLEVACFDKDASASDPTAFSDAFSDRVLGVISTFPELSHIESLAPRRQVPVAYLIDPLSQGTVCEESLAPVVTGSVFWGFYELTKRVLAEGHKKIVMTGRSVKEPAYSELCWRGHAKAMEEAGLSADRVEFDRPFDLSNDEGLLFSKSYLESLVKGTG